MPSKLLLSMCLLLLGVVRPVTAQRLIPSSARGPAPTFDLPQVAGPMIFQAPDRLGRLASADLAGSVTVLDVWSPGCVPCGPVHEALVALAPTLADKGVIVVSIGIADTSAALAWVAGHGGAPFAVTLMTPEFFDSLDSPGLPRMLLLDARGRIAFNGHPHSASALLARVLPSLLAERDGRPEPRDPNRLN